jgi:hypothetical protein
MIARTIPRLRTDLLIWTLVAASVAAATVAVYLGWLRAGTFNDECMPNARTQALLQPTRILSGVGVALNSCAVLGLYLRGNASKWRWASAVVIWAFVVIASAAAIVGGSLCFTLPTP